MICSLHAEKPGNTPSVKAKELEGKRWSGEGGRCNSYSLKAQNHEL
jgi:hypothetical protein